MIPINKSDWWQHVTALVRKFTIFDMTFDFLLRYLGVGRCICSHVVKPLCQVYVLWHPMAQLVHVAKVEHGLSVVLLLRSDPVVERGCLKVDIRP